MRGRDNFKRLSAGFLKAFPDWQLTIEDQIVERDKVVTRFRAQGTMENSAAIPPTGKQITLLGVLIMRFADGKVVEEWEFFDTLRDAKTRYHLTARHLNTHTDSEPLISYY